jgi:hypothetical protein
MTATTVDCPCCSGTGEHVIYGRDPQADLDYPCAECGGSGQVTAQDAAGWRARAAEHTDGPTPHPTAAVPADPFLGPQDAEPF